MSAGDGRQESGVRFEDCVDLGTILDDLPRADEARRAILRDGMTTTTGTTGAPHVNPAVKVERDARAQFMSAWSKLGLDR